MFRVHDRLLTEALVTLIQEGWIAMRQVGQEMHFMVTDEGKRTVESGRQPESTLVRARRQSIVMERLSGQLIRASELMMITRGMLRRARNGRPFREGLPPRVQRTRLNVGSEGFFGRLDAGSELVWVAFLAEANPFVKTVVDGEIATFTSSSGVSITVPVDWLQETPTDARDA